MAGAPVEGVACTAAGAESRQRVQGQGKDTRVLEGLKDEKVLRITPESLACVKTMRSQQRVFSREVTRWGLGGKGHFECSSRLTLDSFSGNLCCGPPQKSTAAEKASPAVPSSPKPLGSKRKLLLLMVSQLPVTHSVPAQGRKIKGVCTLFLKWRMAFELK